MKLTSLLLLLCSDVVLSVALKRTNGLDKLASYDIAPVNCPFMATAAWPYITRFAQGGKVSNFVDTIPRRVELETDIPGAKRIKIRSGPYMVPQMKTKSFLGGHAGMLQSYPDCKIEKPCKGECSILRQVGGLEYTNGDNANIDTGMWLHHMVHIVAGPGRWDAVGFRNASCLPITSMALTPKSSERYFVTGNERTMINYYQGDGKDLSIGTAIQLHANDEFKYLFELMNMNVEDKVVYLTMTYDILEGPLRPGWKEAKAIYLDANSCGTSEYLPDKDNKTQQSGAFSISSPPWKPTVEGKIVYAMGHLHDGGVAIDVTAKGAATGTLCNSTAIYSESPEFVFPMGGMKMGESEDDKGEEGDIVAKDHISRMLGCEPAKFQLAEMKADQEWVTTGYYDYKQRAGNIEAGKQAEIMAVGFLMVAVEPGVKPIA